MSGGTKLFVYGVNRSCPKDILEDRFAKIGAVSDVYITEKGYAFVTMADENDAKAAVDALNGTSVDGQEIKVEIAHGRGSSKPQGGRGGRGGGGYGGERRGGGGGYGFGGSERRGGGGGGRYGGPPREGGYGGDRDGGYRGGNRDRNGYGDRGYGGGERGYGGGERGYRGGGGDRGGRRGYGVGGDNY